MRRSFRIALLGTAATVAAGTVAIVMWPAGAATAALTNPGFESGLSGWSCASTVSTTAEGVHSGGKALLGTPTGSDHALCSQKVSVAANTTYTLSGYVNGGYVFLGVTGGASASTWVPTTSGAYQRLATSFTTSATADTVTVTLNGWYGQPAYRADDLELTGPGGEPSPTSSANPTTVPPTATPTPPASVTPSATVSPSVPATVTPSPSGGSGPGANLAACQHFSSVVPPERTVGPNRDSATQAPRADVSGRLPAPGNIRATLASGTVTVRFDRVAGAVAYRVWRNAQSVRRIEDWGQAELAITDTAPCRGAYYTVAALRGDDGDASIGQFSQPLRLADSGSITASPLTVGTKFTSRVTSYNDAGQTASGYLAGLGLCAVDARYIPWGTRLKVDGYGYCYAADIGTWIQGDIIDVWLPGAEADAWGVQSRTITVVS